MAIQSFFNSPWDLALFSFSFLSSWQPCWSGIVLLMGWWVVQWGQESLGQWWHLSSEGPLCEFSTGFMKHGIYSAGKLFSYVSSQAFRSRIGRHHMLEVLGTYRKPLKNTITLYSCVHLFFLLCTYGYNNVDLAQKFWSTVSVFSRLGSHHHLFQNLFLISRKTLNSSS